jgi:hypothetical protein
MLARVFIGLLLAPALVAVLEEVLHDIAVRVNAFVYRATLAVALSI